MEKTEEQELEIKIQSNAFLELIGSVKELNKRLNSKEKEPKEIWLDNQEIMQLLKISKRTIQHYRDTGLIAFSQVGNKIYYKQSDIEEMLTKHYNVAVTTSHKVFTDETRKLYSENDLAAFGHYLFSKERDSNFSHITDLPKQDMEVHKKSLHHADIENFKHLLKKQTEERQSIIDKANGKL